MTKYLRFFFLLSLLYIHPKVNAQTGTLSPYSRYAIGELLFNGFAYQRAMGGISSAMQFPAKLNFSNPASYPADTLSTAEIGFEGMIEKLSDTSHSQEKRNANLSYLCMSFPVIKNKWGLSIGITPYSAVGYEIKDKATDPVEVTYYYDGSGGINRFYIGNGFAIGKHFSAGFNASYLFGSVYRERRVEYSQSNYLHNRYTNTQTISDILLDFGLQCKLNLKKEWQLMAGLNGSNQQNVHATQNVLWENYVLRTASGDITSARDTVLFTQNEAGSLTFPLNITGGLFLKKNYKWGVGLDVNYQDWSNYKSFGVEEKLSESIRISAGGQWTPDYKSIRYFSRAEYRLGTYYHKGYLSIRDYSVNDYGVTAGVGLPLRKSYQSMVNVSFDFGNRGTVKDNLVEERYARLLIGITFNEDWFHKKKFD